MKKKPFYQQGVKITQAVKFLLWSDTHSQNLSRHWINEQTWSSQWIAMEKDKDITDFERESLDCYWIYIRSYFRLCSILIQPQQN